MITASSPFRWCGSQHLYRQPLNHFKKSLWRQMFWSLLCKNDTFLPPNLSFTHTWSFSFVFVCLRFLNFPAQLLHNLRQNIWRHSDFCFWVIVILVVAGTSVETHIIGTRTTRWSRRYENYVCSIDFCKIRCLPICDTIVSPKTCICF